MDGVSTVAINELSELSYVSVVSEITNGYIHGTPLCIWAESGSSATLKLGRKQWQPKQNLTLLSAGGPQPITIDVHQGVCVISLCDDLTVAILLVLTSGWGD